jgi:hypothetical protein
MAKGKLFPVVLAQSLTGVKPTQKLVFMSLCGFANTSTHIAFPSVEAIATRSCIRPRQTQKILRELEKIGLIMRVKNSLGGRNKETTHYKVNLTHALLDKDTEPKGVPHNTPTDALLESVPCTRDVNTPVPDHTQTNNELYITKTISDLDNEYGKNWKWESELTLQVAKDLKIQPLHNEGVGSLADRIISYCIKGTHGI